MLPSPFHHHHHQNKMHIIRQSLLLALLFGATFQESILSSLLRNNLNKYLKNPLFTKSFVRNSIWNGEFNDQTRLSLISPENVHLNEFINVQNQYPNDNVMDRFNNYKLNVFDSIGGGGGSGSGGGGGGYGVGGDDITKLSKTHLPTIDHLQLQANSQTNAQLSSIKQSKHLKPMAMFNYKNATIKNNSNNNKNNNNNKQALRLNSKSLALNQENVNAYTNNNIYSGNNNYIQLKNESKNRYNDNVVAESSKQQSKMDNKEYEDLNEAKNEDIDKQYNHNLYNQEKALNLKMEYGFKPLPSSSQKNLIHSSYLDTDYPPAETLQSNSIQRFKQNEPDLMNDPSKKGMNDHQQNMNDNVDEQKTNNIYTFFESTSNTLTPNINRSTKSFKDNNSLIDQQSADLPLDYNKKYITFPMETESSDMHKLAFTGTEAFKPDYERSFNVDNDHPYTDILQNFPRIKNFQQEGVYCAREEGYCHYDSNYPKDYVNSIISECIPLIDSMYVEMPENLADFNGYKSFIQVGKDHHHHQQHRINHSLCNADRKYIRPSVIQDINDNFYLILQSSLYIQQIPVEICSSPGSACNAASQCNTRMKCTQKYHIHTLISIADPMENDNSFKHNQTNHQYYARTNVKCPKMRMFRLPSSCVCELSDH